MTDESITIEMHIEPAMLKMRQRTMREQLHEDDALVTMLGRQALALARRKAALREAQERADG
jgi:hypothetical protein